MNFEHMNAIQRRLHNAACVLGADGDEYGFEQLQRDAIAEIERLCAENFALAAGQCANVVGDEGGTPQCKRIAELSAGLADACELLQGWIAAKCPPRYRSEHLAHVEKLRGLLGPNVRGETEPTA